MASSDTYSFFEEHSREDIELVKRLAGEEQQRRIADTTGEKKRRELAHQASELFSLNVRPTWFQKGSTYVLNIIKVARDAGNDIMRSSQVKSINNKIQLASEKSFILSQEIKNRVIVAGDKAQEAGLETANDVKDALQTKFSSGLGTAQDVAQQGLENVQQAAKKLRGMGLKIVGRVRKAFSRLSENTSITFAVLEEEAERTYRLNSELEGYAMLNAFAVARLFKPMAPEFYRPTFEPNALYGVKMLEAGERSRRILRDISDPTAINTAKAVAVLIEKKQRATTPNDAALVAAKAEIVEEIKVHKPIPATM